MAAAGIFDKVQALLGDVTVDDAVANIQRLEDEISEKQAEQAKWRALLGLKQQLGEAAAASNGQAPRPTLPQAVLAYLHELPPGSSVRLKDIGVQLQAKGWLDTDKNAMHRLQMATSKLVKRDELERADRGFYKLPSGVGAPGEESEGTGS
jgi:hypothetical protein